MDKGDAGQEAIASRAEQRPEADGTAALVRPDELTFTILTASDGRPLAKRFRLNAKGAVETTTAATLARGKATVEHAPSIAVFAERLDRLTTSQAVVYGIPSTATARIVTQKRFDNMTAAQRQGVITRTREFLQFAHAPGIAMMDFDAAGAPADLLDAVASPDKARDLLIKAVPGLATAPMLWRPSSSSYLYRGSKKVHGLRGQRIYIAVARASDILFLGKLLYERLWLIGYGYVGVSDSGQLLDRTLLDQAVWQPERLDFAAGPICVKPLERRPPKGKAWNADAPFFDPRRLSALTKQEQMVVEGKRKVAAAAVRSLAQARREQWAQERGKNTAATLGIAEAAAVAAANEAAEHGILRPDFLLYPEKGAPVLVSELLAHPDVWHGRRFRDPMEPDYRGDHRIAWANLRPGRGRPYLYSHAHGGVRYTLSSHRKTIRVVPGQLPQVVDQVVDIIAADGEMYQLKDQIVRVTDDGRLAVVEPEWIVDWIQRQADFLKPTKDGDRPTDLPPKYARTILAKRGEIGLPNLVAITPGPFLRPGGSVVDEPGYDEATQVLYRPTGPGAPSVRRGLTRAETEDALRNLWAPFREFPFATDVDRGAVLALILTAVLRPGLPTAPGGVIESHEAGSGKTLLVQALANLTGVPAIPQALSQYEEEIRKSLFSAARAGTLSIFYDNVGRDRAVDSASLAMVLTSGTIADRILGESTYATVPFRSLLLLTGNNIRIAGDLNRRLLRVSITPNVEHPWTRVFDFDPRARTEANWLSMRVGALELVQAMLADGPPALDGASGYPEWDSLVRATVVWVARNLDIGVSFKDPIQSLRLAYDDDPERDRLRRLMTAWHAAFVNEPMQVREVLEAVEGRDWMPGTKSAPAARQEALAQLDDVLSEFDFRRRSQAIGIYLNQQEGRIVDGLELASAGKQSGSSRWVVRQIEAGEPPVPTPTRSAPDVCKEPCATQEAEAIVEVGVA